MVSDDTLLLGFKEGSNAAFGEVYNRYYPGLFAKCVKNIRPRGSIEDAKDIVSMVFQKLYERRDKMVSMPSITHFLYLSARTKCIDFLRVRGRSKEASVDVLNLEAANDELDVAFWESIAKEEAVMKELKALPSRSKQVIEMYYLKNMKYKDIADMLGLSPRSVENQLRYALGKLRSALTGLEFEATV